MHSETLRPTEPDTNGNRYQLSEEQKAALAVELRIGLALANNTDRVFNTAPAFTEWLMEQAGVDDREAVIEANKLLRRKSYTDRPISVEGGITIPLTSSGLQWLDENLPAPEAPSIDS